MVSTKPVGVHDGHLIAIAGGDDSGDQPLLVDEHCLAGVAPRLGAIGDPARTPQVCVLGRTFDVDRSDDLPGVSDVSTLRGEARGILARRWMRSGERWPSPGNSLRAVTRRACCWVAEGSALVGDRGVVGRDVPHAAPGDEHHPPGGANGHIGGKVEEVAGAVVASDPLPCAGDGVVGGRGVVIIILAGTAAGDDTPSPRRGRQPVKWQSRRHCGSRCSA